MGLDKNGYWSEREVMGYIDPEQDVTYILLLSDRGRGKTYTLKQRMLKWYIEKNEMFMCLYRTTDDMMDAMNDWCDVFIRDMGMSPERFKWDGDVSKGLMSLWFDGAEIGRFRAITRVNSIKHEHFPDNLVNVWWDEFIPLAWKKLPGIKSEGDALRTIVKTVNHDSVRSRTERGLKPLKVFLVANPFTWDNPILTYFKVNPLMGYGVHRVGPGVICEMVPPIETKNGKMTADDFLGNEVNRNQGWMNQMAFIEPIPAGARPKTSMRLFDRYYCLYLANRMWYVKMTNGHVNSEGGMTGTFEGLQATEKVMPAVFAKRLLEAVGRGDVRFPDASTKFSWIQDLREVRG